MIPKYPDQNMVFLKTSLKPKTWMFTFWEKKFSFFSKIFFENFSSESFRFKKEKVFQMEEVETYMLLCIECVLSTTARAKQP